MEPRYRLLARVEEGAYFESYRGAAGDGPDARPVLIRLFSLKASDRAHAEALATASDRARSLGEPRALSYDEVGFAGARLAAVRPWIDGHGLLDGLRRLQSREVVLPPPAALFAVAEAARLVALAHRAGFAHGSLSPAAILLSSAGEVWVESFGALQSLAASPAMAPSAAKGYPGYLAPELESALGATPASDVFGLGAIAYELLTLRSGAPAKGSHLSTKREGLAAPSRVDRRIHARIDPVILRALAPSPARRYADAGELAEALVSVAAALGAAPGPADLARFVRELFPAGVAVGAGSGGGLPLEGPFAIEPVSAGRGTGPRPSPPMPRRAAPIAQESEAKTTPNLPVAPALNEAMGSREKSAADELVWVAPPGEADPSPRLRVLARRGRPGALGESAKTLVAFPGAATAKLPRAPDPSRRRPEAHRPAVFAPAAGGDGPRKTEVDWHAPNGEPPATAAAEARPRRRVGALLWLAICIAGALEAPAIGRRLGWIDEGSAGLPTGHPPPPPSAVGPERPSPRREVAGREEARRPPPGWLSLQTDVPAALFVDGLDIGRSSPIARYPLAPGEHTVLLVDAASGSYRELKVRISSGEELERVERIEPKKDGRRPE
jgi:hypothetical protein